MRPNTYEQSSKFYDYGNLREAVEGDIEFYMELIPSDASVLEVGCGTGRVSIPLAQRGNHIDGVDLSESMLSVFETKLSQNPDITDKIKLHLLDMTDFNLEITFNWIIFPFRSFQCLDSEDKRKKCLLCVKNHMNTESRAILTFFNPKQEIIGNWGKKNILDYEGIDENTGRFVKRYQDHDWIDKERQVLSAKFRFEIYENDVLVDTVPDRLEIGYLFPEQCQKMFEETGFEIVHSYSDYQKNPIVENEQKEQIFVVKKR